MFLNKALDRVSSTFQSQTYTLGQNLTTKVLTEVSGDVLKLKRQASCKSIPEVCSQSTKSLIFHMCGGDCTLARKPELEKFFLNLSHFEILKACSSSWVNSHSPS